LLNSERPRQCKEDEQEWTNKMANPSPTSDSANERKAQSNYDRRVEPIERSPVWIRFFDRSNRKQQQ
jgi:hypothetical protein